MALPLHHTAAQLGPAATEALIYFRAPASIPSGVAYALLPRLGPAARPWVFASLPALARRIHRDRAGDALELKPDRVRFRDRVRDVTAIYARHPVSERVRFLGYAWTAGRPWGVLEAALADACPPALVEG